MNVVLFEPEIPQNTGNIARTCASTGSVLHLIEPLGFAISDAKLKRAGLDYWHALDIRIHKSWREYLDSEKPEKCWLFTTKASANYASVQYRDGDALVFGKETAGLPEDIHAQYPNSRLRIPMVKDNRSLNLSNAVALVLYESLRQQGFPGME